MSIVVIPDRWGLRGGTAADLATVNEIPLKREAVIEDDTGLIKVGDGVTHWNSLPYINQIPATPCLVYTTETGSTADSDPGAGLVKWDNATQSSASKLFFDDATADTGTDLSNLFAELATSSTTGILHMVAESGAFKVYKWTDITDGTGYFKFTVTHLVSSGGNFADNITVRVAFFPMPAAGGGGGSSNWTLVQKTADQNRASTTTFADDSELYTATLGVGTHIVRGTLFADVGAGQLKWQGAFTGTATYRHIRSRYITNTAGTAGISAITTNALPSGAGVSGLAQDSAHFEVVLYVTVAGVFSIQWAQQTSNVANTTMKDGSYLEYR